MTGQKRLTRIETSLTPSQAVRLWLRERQGKTSAEYARWLIQQPVGTEPRIRVEAQVETAIRMALKGQDPLRIKLAVRQARMKTDFLILLASGTNKAVLRDSNARWLQIALFHAELKGAASWNEKETKDWTVSLREFVTDLLSIRLASERIRDEYFCGEGLLLQDVIEDLEVQAILIKYLMAAVDRALVEAGYLELATDPDTLHKAVNERALGKARHIVALARSDMLWNFGEGEASNEVLRSLALQGQ